MEISVEQIRNGDQKSFEQAYHHFHSRLYFYVLKYLHSPYLSEETVQLTFIKLWENRLKLSADLDLSIQVFRVAKSTMIDLLRKERTARAHLKEPVDEASYLYVETDTTFKDELRRVNDLIEELPEARRAVFKLSRFDDLSHKEIAEQLSISPKTVENQISRAIRHLKQKIGTVILFLF
ncbi:MAG: sigma-70 family RNA polymerase sigma factor [Chitinophagaceae bacterium]